MGKFALVAVVGTEDTGVALDTSEYTMNATLPFLKHKNSKDVSINAFMMALKRLHLRPSEVAMDLLVIACTMYAADTRIERVRHGEDSWTRVVDLYIPVSNVALWDAQKNLLAQIFKFLTGDIWTINFRSRVPAKLSICPRSQLSKFRMPYKTDTVCLFSGGLDSFIGAVDLIEQGTRPLLIGHSKSGDVSSYQDKAGNALEQHYPKMKPSRIDAFIKIPKTNLFKSEDHTERGRSFLFLSLGTICASSLGTKSKLYIPENGMISLNIPLTPLRVGSHSTRTTHPHYLSLMQTLMDNLQLQVTLVNPYQFKTKGEMLSECKNKNLVATTETMSCSHPSGRYEGKGNGHCGSCVPCLIRRACYKAAGLKDNMDYRRDIYQASGLKIDKAEGADVLAFKYMIEKVKKNPLFLKAAIRNTGTLGDDVEPYIDVYQRSLIEVEQIVGPVKLI